MGSASADQWTGVPARAPPKKKLAVASTAIASPSAYDARGVVRVTWNSGARNSATTTLAEAMK